MKNIHRFKALSFFLIAADLLAAGGGTVRESTALAKGLNNDGNDDNSNDNSNDDPHEGSNGYGNDDSGEGGNSGSGDD
jgi:hypothetical protein